MTTDFRDLRLDFREILEAAPDAMLLVDPEGKIRFANRQAEKLFGATGKALCGISVDDLVPSRFAAAHAGHRARYAQDPTPRPMNSGMALVARTMDGSEIPVEISLSPVRGGSRPFIAATIRDVSERRRTLEALRESEERFRSLIERMPDVAYRYRFLPTRGSEFIGPAITALTGYRPEEFYQDPYLGLKIVHPEDRPILEKVLRMEDVQGTPQILRWIHRNGQVVWIEHRHAPFHDASGNVVGIEGIARDVTERKKVEEQLRQSQKMEAIGQLAGGVAHDFNNLLTIINGYSEMAMEGLPPGSPLSRDLKEVRSAGERAAAMTRQLLAFSRRQVLDPKVLVLNDVVKGIQGMIQRLIGEAVELVVDLNPDLGRVRVDSGQLDQVLMNLSLNARDAMPNGGRLTFETSNVELDDNYARTHVSARPGRYVMLAVSDTGCGMEAGLLSHIFEPFFTTKETGKGTGLGLATVYGIVKQSAGNISVYSEVGRGTTFKLYFPRVDEAPSAAPLHSQFRPGTAGTETILLVEDEAPLRRFASRVLREKGYDVLEASNGTEALSLFRSTPGAIHLLLTDVVMPVMSGRELAFSIAKLNPKIRVIYCSGYTHQVIVREELPEAGVTFLPKPFTSESLLRTVRERLDAP